MSRGISNFEIEKIFKDINSEDIDDNFLNVFPSNKINKFLMFEKTIPEKKKSFHNFKYRRRRSARHALVEHFKHFSNKQIIVF